jgi:hypothetical protein
VSRDAAIRIMAIPDLHFEPTVCQAFDFLTSKLAFACTKSTPTLVLYVSANVEVEITLDLRSYEVDVEVKRIGQTRSFPLHRIVELMCPQEADRWRLVQTSTPERVKKLVPQLGNLLQKYGRAVLSGDPKAFQRLGELEESDAMRTTRELQIRQARRLAEQEWQSKNYAKVVSILSPIQEELTNSELAKFIYAKKHSQPQ